MEKELTRFELAIVKRTAQNTKALRTKRDKAIAKMAALTKDLQEIEAVIEKFEAPVKEITGGLTSEEVLAVLKSRAEDAEEVRDVETPAEDAVECEATCDNAEPCACEECETCEAAEMPFEDTNA